MGCTGCSMFGIILLLAFHLHVVARGPTILDASMDICADVDVVTKVAGEGLIDLLVALATLTSLGAWQASVVA